MSLPHPSRWSSRGRALIVLGAALVVALGLFSLNWVQAGPSRAALLAQADELIEEDRPGEALLFLEACLKAAPDDVEALRRKAEILSGSARSADQLLAAALVDERLANLSPEGPTGREALRRAAGNYIRYSDAIRASDFSRSAPEQVTWELRYGAAAQLAERLFKSDPKDQVAARFLAMALEGRITSGDETSVGRAIAAYEAALALDPGDVVAAGRLAALSRDRSHDPERAIQVLDDLLAANSSIDAHLARFGYFAAESGQATDGAGRAAAELDLALEDLPDHAGLLLLAAEHAHQGGRSEAARGYLERLDPESRETPRALLLLGLIEQRAGRSTEAIAAWREGLRASGGTDFEMCWRLAVTLLQEGRLEEAHRLVAHCRRLAGSTPIWRMLVGFESLRENRFREAIASLEESREKLVPDLQSQVDFMLGICHEATRDESRALEAYGRAIDVNPRWSGPRVSTIKLLLARQPDRAEEALRSALKAIPGDPNLLALRARIEIRRQLALPVDGRDWTSTERMLAEARSASATVVAPIEAEYLAIVGRDDVADDRLDEAIRRDPKDSGLWIAQARNLARRGQGDAALTLLERAAEPANAGDGAAIQIERARILTERGHGKEARDGLLTSLEHLPAAEHPAVWAFLGDLHSAQGDRDQARRAYSEWARLQPDDPRPRLVLFEQAASSGDQEAIRQGLQALERIAGPEGLHHRVAQVLDLLENDRSGGAGATLDDRLDRAEQLIDKIRIEDRERQYVDVLLGRDHELRGDVDEAITSYEQALRNGVNPRVLDRLLALAIKAGRSRDLDRLRETWGRTDAGLGRRLAEAALRAGDLKLAEHLTRRAVEGQSADVEVQIWSARMFDAMGKAPEAESALSGLTAAQPDQAAPWLALVGHQVAHGQADEAKATASKFEARTPRLERAEFQHALAYYLAGDAAKAASLYETSLRKYPDDAGVARVASEFFKSNGRSQRARDVLRTFLARQPDQRWAARQLAMLLVGEDTGPKGREEARSLIGEGTPDDTPEDRLARALVLVNGSPQQDGHETAIRLLEDLLTDLPAELTTAKSARGVLARVYLADGRHAEAARVAAFDAKRPDATPTAIALHAEALVGAGQYDEAESEVDRLDAATSGDPIATKLRVLIRKEQGRPEDAVRLVEEAIERREETPAGEAVARSLIGLFGVSEDQAAPLADRAEAAERLARRMAARWPQTAWMLGRVLARGDRAEPAIESCLAAANAPAATREDVRQSAILASSLASREGTSTDLRDRVESFLQAELARYPDELDLISLLAFLRHAEGRYEEELSLYRRLESLQPSNPWYLNNIAWLLSERFDDPSAGLEAIDRLLDRVGPVPSYLDTRGMILVRLGRSQEAVLDFQKVVQSMPTKPHYRYHLARAYLKAGQDDAFRSELEMAKAAGLAPAMLEPTERAEMQAILAR